MTPTDVDHITSEQAQLPATEPYSTPAVPQSSRRATSPLVESRERRWWAAAFITTFVIAALVIGFLYVDNSKNQASVRSLTTQNESLTGRNQILQDQLNTTQANLTATLGQLAQTKAELEHPHLAISTNGPVRIKDNTWYLAGNVPDTFTLHLQATSTGPMSVSILTLEEWAKAVQCIVSGAGSANYCMHHSGAVISWLSVTTVNYDFHLAEGCAAYLTVFTAASAVTVTPNISVTYNPASSPTGACA
jgi:outer membrane murein-binding lipoprotein Lpp